MEITIREAITDEDLVALHLLMMCQAEEMAEAPVNPLKVMGKIARARDDRENHFMLVATHEERMVGYLCAEAVSYWYSDAMMLRDFGFYVSPQYRNLGVGKQLKRTADQIAELAGLPLRIQRPPRNARKRPTQH